MQNLTTAREVCGADSEVADMQSQDTHGGYFDILSMTVMVLTSIIWMHARKHKRRGVDCNVTVMVSQAKGLVCAQAPARPGLLSAAKYRHVHHISVALDCKRVTVQLQCHRL